MATDNRKTKVGQMLDNPLKWYLVYVNDFVTFTGFCDYYGLTQEEGTKIVKEGAIANDKRQVIKRAWVIPTLIVLGSMTKPAIAGGSCIGDHGWGDHHGHKGHRS